MQIKCVCQGTSGSCTTKICHRKVSNINDIGEILKEKYMSAVKVIRGNPLCFIIVNINIMFIICYGRLILSTGVSFL